jgi:hypothetical protein
MAEERAQRRLAAILAADVVGHSRLMEQDELGTMQRSGIDERKYCSRWSKGTGAASSSSRVTVCSSNSAVQSTPRVRG